MDTKSAAYAIGYLNAVEAQMPSDETFQKVAAVTRFPVEMLKAAYLKQAGIGNVLGFAALPFLAAPAIKGFKRWYNAPGTGMLGAPHMGMYGGLDPKAEQEFEKMVLREAMKNQASSRRLKMLSGAFRPAPDPWGGGVGAAY